MVVQVRQPLEDEREERGGGEGGMLAALQRQAAWHASLPAKNARQETVVNRE